MSRPWQTKRCTNGLEVKVGHWVLLRTLSTLHFLAVQCFSEPLVLPWRLPCLWRFILVCKPAMLSTGSYLFCLGCWSPLFHVPHSFTMDVVDAVELSAGIIRVACTSPLFPTIQRWRSISLLLPLLALSCIKIWSLLCSFCLVAYSDFGHLQTSHPYLLQTVGDWPCLFPQALRSDGPNMSDSDTGGQSHCTGCPQLNPGMLAVCLLLVPMFAASNYEIALLLESAPSS